MNNHFRNRVGAVTIKIFRKHPEILFAYLYGSWAKGTAGYLSDVDVGMGVRGRLSPFQRHRLRLKVMSELSEALHQDKVDVVSLVDVPTLLQHRILSEGRLLFSKDERARIRWEVRAMQAYFDTMPMRDLQNRYFLKRVQHGLIAREGL